MLVVVRYCCTLYVPVLNGDDDYYCDCLLRYSEKNVHCLCSLAVHTWWLSSAVRCVGCLEVFAKDCKSKLGAAYTLYAYMPNGRARGVWWVQPCTLHSAAGAIFHGHRPCNERIKLNRRRRLRRRRLYGGALRFGDSRWCDVWCLFRSTSSHSPRHVTYVSRETNAANNELDQIFVQASSIDTKDGQYNDTRCMLSILCER